MRKVLAALAIVAVLAVSSLVQAQTSAPSDADVRSLNGTGAGATDAAATSQPGAATTTQPAGGGGGGLPWPMILMAGLLFVMLFWMSRGKNKEAKKRAAMLSTLKKGDKITTIGGVIGTVIEIRADEVTVKVDESSNARMRFARWAIRGIGEDSKAETPGKPDEKK